MSCSFVYMEVMLFLALVAIAAAVAGAIAADIRRAAKVHEHFREDCPISHRGCRYCLRTRPYMWS